MSIKFWNTIGTTLGCMHQNGKQLVDISELITTQPPLPKLVFSGSIRHAQLRPQEQQIPMDIAKIQTVEDLEKLGSVDKIRQLGSQQTWNLPFRDWPDVAG